MGCQISSFWHPQTAQPHHSGGRTWGVTGWGTGDLLAPPCLTQSYTHTHSVQTTGRQIYDSHHDLYAKESGFSFTSMQQYPTLLQNLNKISWLSAGFISGIVQTLFLMELKSVIYIVKSTNWQYEVMKVRVGTHGMLQQPGPVSIGLGKGYGWLHRMEAQQSWAGLQ